MPKNILLSILTLIAAILIFGCEPEAPDIAPLPQPEPVGDIATITEPDIAEPNIPDPVEPIFIPPEDTESTQPAEPDTAEPNEPPAEITEPNTTATLPPPPPPVETKPIDVFNIKFSPIFETYIDDEGMVDYRTLRRKRFDIKDLCRQLSELEPKVYQKWTDAEKIAFWINTYNLMMLDIIIDNYPIESSRFHRLIWPPDSIRHILPKTKVGPSKWDDYKFIVMDEEFTLTEIEKRFFRGQFDDPRVFLTLTLASRDSPPLLNKPYLGQSLDKQLNDQAGRFLNNSSGLRIDKDKNRVFLSAIFEAAGPWYGNEFLKKYGIDKKFKSHPPAVRAVLNFAAGYLSLSSVDYLETGSYEIRYKTYDWRLNDR